MKKSFSIPSFSLSDNNEQDPIIGLTAYPSRRQNKRTATSHDDVVAMVVSPNTGLINTGMICYSNAIFQALASCYRTTTLFNHSLHAPNQDRDRFRLCFAFVEVLRLLVNRPSSEPFVFYPRRFIDVFRQTHSNFIDEESEYSLHRGRPR
jgi:ubiquitin C-terminal hydrolase